MEFADETLGKFTFIPIITGVFMEFLADLDQSAPRNGSLFLVELRTSHFAQTVRTRTSKTVPRQLLDGTRDRARYCTGARSRGCPFGVSALAGLDALLHHPGHHPGEPSGGSLIGERAQGLPAHWRALSKRVTNLVAARRPPQPMPPSAASDAQVAGGQSFPV